MDVIRIILRTAIAVVAVLTALSAMSSTPTGTEATAKISVKNFGGKELVVNHTGRGIYNPKWEVVKFGADSTTVISIPTDGVEYIGVSVTDVQGKQRNLFKRIYVLPGLTEVNINPAAEEPISVKASTGNPVDGEVAEAISGMSDIYILA